MTQSNRTNFGSFSISTLNPKSNRPAQSPFSIKKLQLGVSIFSSGPAAGVKALRGAIMLVVRIIESLTTSSEEVEWGSGVKLYVDKGSG